MKIYIASDHAAFDKKDEIAKYIESKGIEVLNLGTDSEASVNYPEYAKLVSQKVLENEGSRGILICGTGIGMSIAANRFKGIRAALCRDANEAKLSRAHNDSNILCMGGRTTDFKIMKEMVDVWLNTEAETGRHALRREMMDSF